MSLVPSWVDFTDRDFDALAARGRDLIRSVYPDWTDFQVHNFGNILIDSFFFVGDVLDFYNENQAREGRWAFVQHRKNAIALAKLINYTLSGASPASADLVFTLENGPLPGDVILYGATSSSPRQIRTLAITDPIIGELQETITIPAGSPAGTQVAGTWKHSIKKHHSRVSTGLPNFRIPLPVGPYLDNSASVSSTGEGSGWIQVSNFLNSGPTSLHFMVVVNHYDKAEVVFGDGTNGKVPTGTVNSDYEVGGGKDGNVDPDALQKIVSSVTDTLGNLANVSVTNPAKAEGGAPREEVAAAKVNAPSSLRVLNRTVAREDYEINALRVSSVGRALMLTANEQEGMPENWGRLYIIPKSGGTASQAMKDDVYEMVTVTYPNTITFQLEVADAVYQVIDIRARIWIREGYTPAGVKADILEELGEYFAPVDENGTANPNVDFGFNYKDEDGEPAGEMAWSDVFNVVRDSAGCRKVDPDSFLLNGARDDVQLDNHKFPKLGTLTLVDGATGTEI